MKNSVRKMFPLAIALLLALCGAAAAGNNANVVISLDSEEYVSAGAGEQVQVALSAAGMVGVKQVEVTLTLLPADAFDLAATTFTPAFGFSPGVELLGDGQIKSGVATLGETVDGDGALGVFTLTTSSSFDEDSSAEIWVNSASLGASSVDRDVFDAAALGLGVIVNWPINPATLTATSSLAANPAYSPIGTGAVTDGSPGELEFSVNFQGNSAKGQTIAWDITNNGSRSVYLLGVGEVPSGAYVCLRNVTDGAGDAAIQFDSEGNLKAAATSLEVRARTDLVNAAGAVRRLAVDFNAMWAVPDADQLMFVEQVSLNSDDKARNELVAGPGIEIPVELSAAGLVGVEQVAVTLTVSPADAFDLAATTFAGSDAFSLSAPAVEVSGSQVQGGAVVSLNDDAVNDDSVLGTFTLVTSDSFTEETEAEIVIHSVSLGPSSSMRDYLDAELLNRSMHLNRPDPMLVAAAPLVGNALISGADTGAVDDSSPGEIEYSVNFTNLWGNPGEGQRILWDVYNRSVQSVSVLGIGTIPPGGSAFLRNTTDTDGNSSIEVDAEVVSFLSIQASTTTENAAGKTLDLAVDFSAAWAAAKQLAAVPLANSLSQNYPNPFNPETTIPYDLSSDAIVSLTIYNIAGQVVRKLVDGESLAAGQYQAMWDGRNESGASVASGMYFYLLHAGDYVAKRKMVLLR